MNHVVTCLTSAICETFYWNMTMVLWPIHFLDSGISKVPVSDLKEQAYWIKHALKRKIKSSFAPEDQETPWKQKTYIYYENVVMNHLYITWWSWDKCQSYYNGYAVSRTGYKIQIVVFIGWPQGHESCQIGHS